MADIPETKESRLWSLRVGVICDSGYDQEDIENLIERALAGAENETEHGVKCIVINSKPAEFISK